MATTEKKQAEMRFIYYWQGYDNEGLGDFTPSSGGGGGGGSADEATREYVDEAIDNALRSIQVQRRDNGYAIVTGDDGREAGIIEDTYLTGVESGDDSDGNRIVKFIRNNGEDSIDVGFDVLDDPNLDMQTF